MFPQPIYRPTVVSPATVISRADDYESGSISGEWAADDVRINRSYTNRVKIDLINQYIGPAQVIALTGVKIGDTYRFPLYSAASETDTGSFVQRIAAEKSSEHNADGGCMWKVTIEYAPGDVVFHLGSGYLSTGQVDPTAHVLEVFWDSAKYEISRPYDFSSTPKPYLNTAGDPLLDPPPYEETRSVLKIIRREPYYDEPTASSYRNTINQDVFFGCPPSTVKCRDIRGERDYDPDWGIFWRINYEFEFRVDPNGDGFKQLILSTGLRYKPGGTGTPINAVDGQGHDVTDAVNLQKSGDKVPDGGTPYIIEFVGYPSSAFAGLNIPQDLLTQNI